MWDLAGRELTGVYGTWSERIYELVDAETDMTTLLMSSDESPGPDWIHRIPDAFYGESMRWSLSVPRSEVTEVHTTIVQGAIDGTFVDVLAQRQDRSWAVKAEGGDESLEALLRRLGVIPANSTWNGWVPEPVVSITARASYVPWPQPCC